MVGNPMAPEPIIRVTNFTARYGENIILKDISFEVSPGEVFIILGGSGCGKSTLLRHLIGLNRPFAGTIRVDGIDISSCGDNAFQDFLKNIGVLFQSSALIGAMTLGENIALPILEYTSLPQNAVDKMVRLKLHMVDLDGYENRLPSELSGGMKKRAGLARAIALNPKILFLDEPSAGLDPITSAEIDELVLHINRNMNTTIVIVTHDLDSIFRIGQRAIMLDKETRGIIAEGRPTDLKTNSSHPMVRKFFNSRPTAEPESFIPSSDHDI